MSELKNCPCCRGANILEIDVLTGFNADRGLFAECVDCGVRGRADAWNRRSPDPIREELAAALEGVVRVADRKTAEFDAAHAALSKHRSGG